MIDQLAAAAAVVLTAAAARPPAAEEPGSPLEAQSWGVVYDVPATAEVEVVPDLVYRRGATGPQALDLYLPPDAKQGEPRPVVVFLNAIGDPPDLPVDERLRRWGIYRTWPRLIAAHGLAGVAMDAEDGAVEASMIDLFAWLARHGGEHGVDGSRVGVYAASANVAGASDLLLGPKKPAAVRAAVLYYGAPPQLEPRRDLPVLFLVAESDVPRMGESLDPLWQRVVRAKAPWTLVFGSRMPHAFDAFRDDDEARRLIQQTIAFWKSHLEPVGRPQPPPSEARAILAALYGNETERAVELLTKWVAAHPDDGKAQVHLGRVLAEVGRFADAGRAYERALALGEDDPGAVVGLGFVRAGEKNWQEAAELLGRAVAAGVNDSRVLGQLGLAYLMLGRDDEGVDCYEQAFAAGIPPGASTRGVAAFNLACGYARLGRDDAALEQLGVAVTERFATRRMLETDPDLAPLRDEPRFRELLATLPAR